MRGRDSNEERELGERGERGRGRERGYTETLFSCKNQE
jgi:hypothetical protein